MTKILETKTHFIIYLTDITLHTQKPRKPQSFARHVSKAMRNKNPGRVFVPAKDNGNLRLEKNTFEFTIPLDGMEGVIKKANDSGKSIQVIIPENMPIFLGDDVIERMNSNKSRA